MSLRDTFRRDQVFGPLRPGTRPVRPGQLDTGGKHILYMEDITVSFDGLRCVWSVVHIGARCRCAPSSSAHKPHTSTVISRRRIFPLMHIYTSLQSGVIRCRYP